jgi:ATP-dependent RNA helicase DDX24/MAK5
MSNQRRENNASIQNKKRKRSDKRTRQLNKGDRKRAKRMSEEDAGLVVSADQLEWQKISLQNDEFDDFEEIEGVDVDYVDKDGSKVIQFKVREPFRYELTPAKVVNKRKQMGKPMVAKAVKTREETTSEEEWGGIVDSERNSLAEEEAERAQNPIENLEVWQTDVDLPGWSKLSLSQPTLQALNALGFAAPTEIQSLAIPRIMQGHDLIGKASTGSGKTLAFGIPILEHILSLPDPKTSSPSALVIAPTRELAKQIVAHLQDIAKFAAGAMTIVNVTGGLAVQKQIRLLEKRPSVIVGTPGRLWELFDNAQDVKNLDLSSAMKVIKFLVLDEADRLLQEGHFSEIEKILDFVNSGEGKQTLVFSATFQKQLQQKLKGKKSFEGNLLSKDDALGTCIGEKTLTV